MVFVRVVFGTEKAHFASPPQVPRSAPKVMATPGTAPIQVTLEPGTSSGLTATHALLAAMLRAHTQVSDLIFSPGVRPNSKCTGNWSRCKEPGLKTLTADDTRRIASDLIGNNKQAITTLREQGSCDISFGLARAGALSGQCIYSARQLRGGDARDSYRDSGVLCALGLPRNFRKWPLCGMGSCW